MDKMSYDESMALYRKNHMHCPNCFSDTYASTLFGYILIAGKENEFKDTNDAFCKCKFKHTIHDRISKEQVDEILTNRARATIRKILELGVGVDVDGDVWGHDTYLGNIDELIDSAVNIIKEESNGRLQV